MDALIDTNVLLTYVTNRPDPYLESSIQIMEMCASGRIDGFIAFHSLSTIWYVLRRSPEEERRGWLRQIVELLKVVGADNEKILEAIEMDDFKDFEDCLQYECAKAANVDYIITGNIKDFRTVSDIKVVTPDEMVQIVVPSEEEGKNFPIS